MTKLKEVASVESFHLLSQRCFLFQTQLNLTDEAWSMLALEDNPDVLSAVLWDWLDQLKVCNQGRFSHQVVT